MDAVRQATTQLWTGTSMAAGYVSGAVALYLEGHPYASADAVKAYLTMTAGTAVDAVRSPRAGMVYVGTRAARTTISRR
jgi:subtilisin family serine protease